MPLNLPRIDIPFEIRLEQPIVQEFDAYEPCMEFDLDADGATELMLQVLRGRGPLSTYWGQYRLRGIAGTTILSGGLPLTEDSMVTIDDAMQGVPTADLFSMSTSLRVTLTESESHAGPWWGAQDVPLAIAIRRGESLRYGYVRLSVSATGTVSIGATKLVEVRVPAVPVTQP